MSNQITRSKQHVVHLIRMSFERILVCSVCLSLCVCMCVMWLKEINTRLSCEKYHKSSPLGDCITFCITRNKIVCKGMEGNDVLQKCNITPPSYNLVFLSLSQFYIKALSVALVNIDQYCSYPIRIIHSRYHAGNASNVYALEDIVILCLCLTSTIIQQRQDFNDSFCEIDRRSKLNRNNYLDVECDTVIFFNVTIRRF